MKSKPSQTSRQTIKLLVIKFSERIILRNSDVNWLAKLCDLRGNTTVNAKQNTFFSRDFLMEGKEIQL